MTGQPKRIFKPDWMPEGGEDRGLQAKHTGETVPASNPKPVDFQERFKRVVIPGT